MNAIVAFFEGIASAVSGAIDFLLGLVFDLVYVVQLLGRFLRIVPSFLTWLPPELLSIVLVAITIAVIYKIIGR